MILLTIGGPPLHVRPHEALHVWTLREVLAAFLWTRAWARSARADAWEITAATVQGAALAHPAPGQQGQERARALRRWLDSIRRYAESLRGAEGPSVRSRYRAAMTRTPETAAFYRIGPRANAEGEEDASP